MTKEYKIFHIINDDLTIEWYVKHVDYLKVVEEKEEEKLRADSNWEMLNEFEKNNIELKNIITIKEKEIKEKDEEIEELKEIVINNGVNYSNLSNLYNERQELKKENEEKDKEIEDLKERIKKADSRVDSYEEWYNNNVYHYNKMKEENKRLKEEQEVFEWNNNELIRLTNYVSQNTPHLLIAGELSVSVVIGELERLKNLYEPEKQYEDWCELKYWYEDIKTGTTKMYRQHMNYEEACELIGMNSDNWNEFNVVKYKKEVK